MMVYQRKWLFDLRTKTRDYEVDITCKAIVRDDTGKTDALTQQLAKKVIELLEKQKEIISSLE